MPVTGQTAYPAPPAVASPVSLGTALGAGTWYNTPSGLAIMRASAGAVSISAMMWTPPATPWRIGIEWSQYNGHANNHAGLIFARGGKYVVFGTIAGSVKVMRFDNLTTFNAAPAGPTAFPMTLNPVAGTASWMRFPTALVVTCDGTTLQAYQSPCADYAGTGDIIAGIAETCATFLGGVPTTVGVHIDPVSAAEKAIYHRVVIQ